MAIEPSMLRNALAPSRKPYSPATAEAAFGGGATGRSELAMAIAGTTDKSSRAYKSARRNLERYAAAEGKQRRHMGEKMRPEITRAVQNRRAAERLSGPVSIRLKAPTIKVSDESRQRLDLDLELSAADMAEVRALLEANDDEAAAEAFGAATMAAYFGTDRADAQLIELGGLTIHRET